jgi:hypothetical protein
MASQLSVEPTTRAFSGKETTNDGAWSSKVLSNRFRSGGSVGVAIQGRWRGEGTECQEQHTARKRTQSDGSVRPAMTIRRRSCGSSDQDETDAIVAVSCVILSSIYELLDRIYTVACIRFRLDPKRKVSRQISVPCTCSVLEPLSMPKDRALGGHVSSINFCDAKVFISASIR